MQTASSPSPYTHDESDRGSLQSAATIDVKELIKKCLRNLRGKKNLSESMGDKSRGGNDGSKLVL